MSEPTNTPHRLLSKHQSVALALPLIILLALVYIVPIVALLPQSMSVPHLDASKYYRLIEDPLYRTILLRTFRVSIEVTILVLVIGFMTAYTIWRASSRTAAVLLGLVMFPLLTSVIVRNYAWVALLAHNGAISQFLRALGVIDTPLRLLNTEYAVLIGMVHVQLPYAILPIYNSLKRIEPAHLSASASLGAPPLSTFLRITVPLCLPGILGASVLTFVLSLGFYITPAILGGPRSFMIANLIDQQINYLLNFGQGAAMALTVLAISLTLVVAAFRFLNVDRLLREGQ